MNANPRNQFRDVLKQFHTAMLVTRSPNGALRSRPMHIAEVESDSALWFVTNTESGKMGEIEADPHVNVSMQSGTQYLSINGVAHLEQDRDRIRDLWSESWAVWFPDGLHDPHIGLIRVEAKDGEYWDMSGLKRFQYLFRAGQALIQGDTVDMDSPAMHGRVNL